MKQNENINVNRMLILPLSKTKQMMPETYSVFFLWREYFLQHCKKLWYLLRTNVLAILLKGIYREYVNLVPCCAPQPVFRTIVLQVSRSLETGNALDTLGMREKKKKKQLKPKGSAGAVKQVVPFPLRLKTTAKPCVSLDPCAWPGTMGAS